MYFPIRVFSHRFRCSALGSASASSAFPLSCQACPKTRGLSRAVGIGPGEALADTIVGAGCGGRLLEPVQPCRARRSQSLLLGVELELQRSIAQRLPSTVGLGCWKSCVGREEPCSQLRRAPALAASLERLRHEGTNASLAGLVACCSNLLIRVGGKFMGKWGAVQGSVCGGEQWEGESVPFAGIGCRIGFDGRCGGGARDGGSSL